MIPLFKVFMSNNASREVTKVLKSGYIGQGPMVDKFEKNLKEWFQLDYLLTTNSATSAEHLALHMLKKKMDGVRSKWDGLNDGDEVLCTPLTCTATNWTVLANNLNIKWVDVDRDNLNMCLTDLRRKITPKTKVIYVVHWGGYPLDLDELKRIQIDTQILTCSASPCVLDYLNLLLILIAFG